MKIKVCGLRDPENILTVAGLYPDYMGFIYYDRSPRFINDLSAILLDELPSSIYTVAVFVDEKKETIDQIIDEFGFDAVQLHGEESADFAYSFKNKVIVIKAFGLNNDFNFEQLHAYVDKVDFFLFDTKTDKHGGSGKTFDWQVLNKYDMSIPFFLSGGISLDNLNELKNINHPQFYGIDLNSKFETAPGIKDISKLEKAFEIIKQNITDELRS